jgi:Methyltransferase domain
MDPAFASRLERLDVSLFKGIPSQTKTGDRASLLALQEAVATRFGTFAYLEIGSHLGGSLQAAVRDPRVGKIVSIDLRPEATPDERGKQIPYAGNSTQRMLDNLAALPGADLDKVETIDADTRMLNPGDIAVRPRLCFIDGEHTNESCLADARFCRAVAAPDAVIAFHDSGLIFAAIATFLEELRRDGVQARAYPLPDSVFAVELGDAPIHETAAIGRLLEAHGGSLHPLAALLARRTGGIEPARRLLLRAWLSEPAAGKRLFRRRMAKRRKVLRKRALRRVRRARKALRI